MDAGAAADVASWCQLKTDAGMAERPRQSSRQLGAAAGKRAAAAGVPGGLPASSCALPSLARSFIKRIAVECDEIDESHCGRQAACCASGSCMFAGCWCSKVAAAAAASTRRHVQIHAARAGGGEQAHVGRAPGAAGGDGTPAPRSASSANKFRRTCQGRRWAVNVAPGTRRHTARRLPGWRRPAPGWADREKAQLAQLGACTNQAFCHLPTRHEPGGSTKPMACMPAAPGAEGGLGSSKPQGGHVCWAAGDGACGPAWAWVLAMAACSLGAAGRRCQVPRVCMLP